MTIPPIKRILRYVYFRIVRIHGKPRPIALGMALGLLIGMSPTFGFQMVLALGAAALLGQSKISAVAGVWITNPVSAPFIYAITYAVGALVLGQPIVEANIDFTSAEAVMNLGVQALVNLWVGGFVLGVPIAIIGYYATLQLVYVYKLHRIRQRQAKQHEWIWCSERGEWRRAEKSTTEET